MAGIDKIYVTYNQYVWFYMWMNEVKLPYGFRRRLYKYDSEALERLKLEKRKFPISNFPKRIDMWLLENCRLKFIKKRVREQYGIDKET
jgi:hypothetical protein